MNKYIKFLKANPKKTIIIIAAALGILLLAVAVSLLSARPSAILKSKTVTLQAGSVFSAEKYVDSKNTEFSNIKIAGNVNTGSVGKYKVTYTLGKKKEILTVKVQDTVAPVLKPKENLSFKAGTEINAEMLVDVKDATACKLQLKNPEQSLDTFGKHTLTVCAVDGGKNTASCRVEIVITDPDTTAPVIFGIKKITVTVGEQVDLKKGVTVKDDMDPSPVLKIDDGGLNTSKIGTYTVKYTATDKSGNVSVVKRTVSVTAKPVIYTPKGGTYGWSANGIAGQPYLVAVNRSQCAVTVYGKDADGNYTVPTKAFACSVGRAGNETPTGRYNTTDRYEWRLMVDGSYGRYAIRINGSIMFHSVCYFTKDKTNLEYEEYNKLGSPASLGCIRLSVADEKWIYDNCPKGFPTVIYDDNALSGPLGKPTPLKIDTGDTEKRGWDPTDWDANSPWKK